MSKYNIYFAAKEPKDVASVLMGKTDDWFRSLEANGYLDKLRTMWAAYHGAYYTDSANSHSISFAGEQGELAQMSVNHLRNLAQHMLNMITSTRPAMQARSTNTDYASLVQTKLANGLLDYYMRDHRLESFLKTAVEYSIVFGSGYIKLAWNATRGDVYDVNDETGEEIREGDIEFCNLSPFDVMFDTNREDKNHDWVVCRSFMNRHDLAAKYPEHEDEIKSLPTKSDLQGISNFTFSYDQTDLIPVYEFYHKKTESMPDGRYLLFLSGSLTLLDSPMPYRALPIYAIAPNYFLGTPYGYTPMFDILGMQDAVNSLYSTILTNQTAFGVQNILVPKGADVSVSSLSGGLNIIEANMQAGRIEALNLTQTPKEIFDFIGMLEKTMETISGVNSVSRGNPDPSLKSGNALALVQSMTLQFMSGLQQSYVALIEDLGTGVINTLKDHATTPRIASIVGKNNKSYIKEFTGQDLSSISRVIVDIANPLSKTTAGKVEMAEQMMQMGVIKTPEQYFSVINTGQLDVMTEDTQSQLFLVKSENERFVGGEPVIAVMFDDHMLHIKEHASVLADPQLRFEPDIVQRVTEHIQEHINLLRTTDPALLQMLNQQPLGPQGGSPANPQEQNIPASAMQGQAPELMGGAPVASQLDQQGAAPQGLPSIPSVNSALLPNPELQDQAMANLVPQGQQ
jgi:hypothetical protein